MALRIEDYGLIGDTHTAALVGKEGSIDWLCFPRFDSDACFAALLGTEQHGRWLLAPVDGIRGVERRYREGTLVLETDFTTDDGAVRVTDCMPIRRHAVVRVAECLRGQVTMTMELVVRFNYGATIPWIRVPHGVPVAVAGPDAIFLYGDVESRRQGSEIVSRFTLSAGQRAAFVLLWSPSHEPAPRPLHAETELQATTDWWREWSGRCQYRGRWRDEVLRSLITLKALSYEPTGGLVAAATTSLPEKIGGVRNWDYRYCWVRDATLTLYAFSLAGYGQEALSWHDWLLRAAAGHPAALQIMYGPAGERRLPELVLDWLPGYENSKPVRIGNAAVGQFQLDVYGEVMDSMHLARRAGIPESPAAWDLQRSLLDYLEKNWNRPDEGIWEVRGPRQHFVHSKVMAWVAFDRAVKAVERFGLKGDVEKWRLLRAEIHDEVCRKGYDPSRGTFTQYYGSQELDASLLMIPEVGFLPPKDERVRGTLAAIERELCRDGFVMRYPTSECLDGLPPGEGAFLACTFWLADNLELTGRHQEALDLFERLLALRNDLGLLSEEYDPTAKRLVGNFPQAFTHVAMINTAWNLSRKDGPAKQRKQ